MNSAAEMAKYAASREWTLDAAGATLVFRYGLTEYPEFP